MSTYEYKNSPSTMHIKPSTSLETTFLWVHEDRKEAAILIPNADVPTVAAELLKAAGQESVIVRKAVEEVRSAGGGWLACGFGPEEATGRPEDNPNWLWNKAANYIALAEHIENKAQRETEAAKKLQERRDALANELSGGMYTYAHVAHSTQQAIDRIIEMEQARD